MLVTSLIWGNYRCSSINIHIFPFAVNYWIILSCSLGVQGLLIDFSLQWFNLAFLHSQYCFCYPQSPRATQDMMNSKLDCPGLPFSDLHTCNDGSQSVRVRFKLFSGLSLFRFDFFSILGPEAYKGRSRKWELQNIIS